jgi:hypothetical protein
MEAPCPSGAGASLYLGSGRGADSVRQREEGAMNILTSLPIIGQADLDSAFERIEAVLTS